MRKVARFVRAIHTRKTVARLALTLHARARARTHTHARATATHAWVTSGVWNTRARPRCACTTHAERQAERRERRVPDALEACTAQNRYGESSRIISFTGLRTRDARNPRVNRRPHVWYQRDFNISNRCRWLEACWLRSCILCIRGSYVIYVETLVTGVQCRKR